MSLESLWAGGDGCACAGAESGGRRGWQKSNEPTGAAVADAATRACAFKASPVGCGAEPSGAAAERSRAFGAEAETPGRRDRARTGRGRRAQARRRAREGAGRRTARATVNFLKTL